MKNLYLKNVKLWNFRKFGSDVEIDLNSPNLDIDFQKGLNLIIGENDSGKTAIIDAIKLVLKTSSNDWIRLSDDDFYRNSLDIRIEVQMSGFSEDEAALFVEYLSSIMIDSQPTHELKLIFEAERRNGKIKSKDIRAAVDGGKFVLADARERIRATYLKPLRDAKSELIPKKNSRLSQIFSEHDAFKEQEDHLLLSAYSEFNESIEAYFKGEDKNGQLLVNDQRGKALKKNIDDNINQFFEATAMSQLTTASVQLRKVLESLELSLVGFENPGLGSLNRLFMASELIHLNKENWTGLRLGLVEEIEAHLHPQVQLKVIKSLLKLDKTQFLLTTHSPNLASKVPLENHIICRNENAFPMKSDYTDLSADQYVFLNKFLDVTRSSLFFARGLILVEGWSEELLVPIIADRIGYNLIDNEVTVINVSNLGFENYYKIFSRSDGKDMGMKISIITDSDVPAYHESINESQKTYEKVDEAIYQEGCLESVTNIRGKYSGAVNAFVATEWTLEWCLMKSTVLGDIFLEVVKEIHSQGSWGDAAAVEKQLAEKLYKKTLKKTEIAYRMVEKLNNQYYNEDLRGIENDETLKHIYEAIENACTR